MGFEGVFSGEGADGWYAGGWYDDEREAIEALWDSDPAEAGKPIDILPYALPERSGHRTKHHQPAFGCFGGENGCLPKSKRT